LRATLVFAAFRGAAFLRVRFRFFSRLPLRRFAMLNPRRPFLHKSYSNCDFAASITSRSLCLPAMRSRYGDPDA
jgi:hypothetical protein